MAFHNIPPNGFPDIPDMEELEAIAKDMNTLKTSVAGLTTDVSNLSDNKANQITIAPFFNAETAYEVGDLVYYNGLSYRCTNDHEGEWDADDFAATTVAGELATLKNGLTELNNESGTQAMGQVAAHESVNIQLPTTDGKPFLLCTYADNVAYASMHYLTFHSGYFEASAILTGEWVSVTDKQADYVITIANNTAFPYYYVIKRL